MSAESLSYLLIYGDSMKSNRMQANVRYLTNFVDEVLSYIFFPLEGEPTQWMDIRPHLTNAKAVSVIKDMRSRLAGWWGYKDMGQVLVERIKEARLENGKIDLVCYQLVSSLPHHIMQTLTKGFPNAEFKNLTLAYDRVQIVHSPEYSSNS